MEQLFKIATAQGTMNRTCNNDFTMMTTTTTTIGTNACGLANDATSIELIRRDIIAFS